jgi:recombination protein RecT
MTETVGTAVEQRKETAGAMVRTYADSFTAVLPTHVKPDTWVRLAQGALKRGKRIAVGNGADRRVGTELEIAALNNPQVFLAALLEAARLGLEPGTEQYYLTPRKEKGQLQILGIVGYQGYIELMYRAGAISSVVAECVYANDKFEFRPGVDERPKHEIDWDSENRGKLRLAYAYSVMKDGATSKVVVLNRAAIERIKKSSVGSDSQYSPWRNHEDAMWLKSAVRQLAKWVPTSAEYVREMLRAQQDVAGEGAPQIPAAPQAIQDVVDATERGDLDEHVIDAEVVDEDLGELRADDPDLQAGG